MKTSFVTKATSPLLRAVDEVVVRSILTPLPPMRDPIEALDHGERLRVMKAFRAFYGAVQSKSGGLYTRRASLSPVSRRLRRYGRDGEVSDLSWDSEFSPLWSEQAVKAEFQALLQGDLASAELREAIETCQLFDARLGLQVNPNAHPENRAMHARWFRHLDGPRPCAVILHGYLGGHLSLEEHIWPIRALFDGGMDVVLTVLPMHGMRAPKGRRLRLPLFPGTDPRAAIEGFRQMVHDHLSLFDYLLDGRTSSLGAIGMSLGGYSAALLATLDPRLEFGVFHMPLVSLADFALRSGRMVGTATEQRIQTQALEKTYRVVSPLCRPSLLPKARVLVSEAQSDMITGAAHARTMADHFGVETVPFAGSHIAPLGARAAFAPMWKMLDGAGLWQAPS